MTTTPTATQLFGEHTPEYEKRWWYFRSTDGPTGEKLKEKIGSMISYDKATSLNGFYTLKTTFWSLALLQPLTCKGARQVARELEYWIQLMGPVLHILQRHGIKQSTTFPKSRIGQTRKFSYWCQSKGQGNGLYFLLRYQLQWRVKFMVKLRSTPYNYEVVFNQQARTGKLESLKRSMSRKCCIWHKMRSFEKL